MAYADIIVTFMGIYGSLTDTVNMLASLGCFVLALLTFLKEKDKRKK